MLTNTYDMHAFIPRGSVSGKITLMRDDDGGFRGFCMIFGNYIAFDEIIQQDDRFYITGEAAIPFGIIRFSACCEIKNEKDLHATLRIRNSPDSIEVFGRKSA